MLIQTSQQRLNVKPAPLPICGNAQHSRRGRERRDRHRHVPSCRLRLVPREPRPRGPPPANEERRTKARNEERFCLCRMSGLSADCAPRGWGDRLGTPRRRDGRHAFGRAVPEKRARADSQSSHHPPFALRSACHVCRLGPPRAGAAAGHARRHHVDSWRACATARERGERRGG